MNFKKTALALSLVALSKQGNPINYQQQIQQPMAYPTYPVQQPMGVGVGVGVGVPMYNGGMYGGYGYFPGYAGGPWGFGYDDWDYDGGRRRDRSHSSRRRRRSRSRGRRNYYSPNTNSTSH
jgi:hypothetical protein